MFFLYDHRKLGVVFAHEGGHYGSCCGGYRPAWNRDLPTIDEARRTGQSADSQDKFAGKGGTSNGMRCWPMRGDLKDTNSLADACRGVDAIISTASSTLSRQAGDSIESVDDQGQLNLVEAAKAAGVDRFVFVSFRHSANLTFPLADAKAHVENAIKALNFTTIQASWFMEIWLSPALGFDYANATVRIYGSGTSPVSWVSFQDVAEMCVL